MSEEDAGVKRSGYEACVESGSGLWKKVLSDSSRVLYEVKSYLFTGLVSFWYFQSWFCFL